MLVDVVMTYNRASDSEKRLTVWRRMIICRGGIFTFYQINAEGFATSEPYNISDNPLLFVYHVLHSAFSTGAG